MGMTVEEAALGIVRVANATMLRALRRVTVERGIDGRRCALLAFGGAGPMHAVELARAFSIATVIVPAHSSVFSALGCAGAGMSYSQQRTLRMAVDEWDAPRVDRARRELKSRLAAPLVAAGYDEGEVEVEEVAAIRYRGQSYAIEIAGAPFDDPQRLTRRFLDRHRALYGFATEEPWELVSIRLRVSAPRTDRAGLPATPASSGEALAGRTLPCTFDAGGPVPTPRHARAGLVAGRALAGPAVVEDAWSTVVVPPGATLVADEAGHLHIATGVRG